MIRPRYILKAAGHGDHGDDWRERGACAGHPEPDLFHPDNESPARAEARALIAEVVAICSDCPVRDLCLAYALSDPSVTGLWAGTTTAEREGLRRRDGIKDRPVDREPPTCGTYRGYLSHRHYGEPVDEACRRSAKDAEAKRRQRARQKAMSA